MKPRSDVFLTAIAPVVWGTTYYVTTQFLPHGYPITVAMLRAFPAGLLLFLFVRQVPERHWWGKMLLLGALNISVFLICLFIAAYRLPGGVAATVAASQPLIVVFVERGVFGGSLRAPSVLAAITGIAGVALLVFTPQVVLDPVGLTAGFLGAASMAVGNVLSKKWKPPEASLIAFTSWQLIAGGLLLVPVAVLAEPPLPPLNVHAIAGLAWLSLIGAALTYVLWFRGVGRMKPTAVSALLFLSPTTAVIVGWSFLGQRLNALQIVGVLVVLASVWASQTTEKSAAGVDGFCLRSGPGAASKR